VLELRETRGAVVTCVADPATVDAIVGASPADALRVAPDEALLIAEGDAAALVAGVEASTDTDADALIVDTSDGWSIWTIAGDAAAAAFARLSPLEPADGFAQGEVAHLPAKVVAAPSRIRLLVPAMWREALRERILDDCADLGIREAEPISWSPAT
jgi:sarcosine oxidase gamma subunit